MNPKCEMEEQCLGEKGGEVKACRGPEQNLMELCNPCLESGWGANVEVLE